MTLSLVLAWLTVLLVVVTGFKYIARVSKSMKLNRLFHKIHIPTGMILILTGLLHGLAAGNFADTGLFDMRAETVLFTFNWGTVCFIISVLLGLTYLFRKVLKKKWMRVHRILTVCMLVLMVIHIADIEILEENDTPDFFERAEAIIDDIIDGQSLEVDTVSGATYSSSGILNAVNNALEEAVTDGELEKNDVEIPSGSEKRHGGRYGKNRNRWA